MIIPNIWNVIQNSMVPVTTNQEPVLSFSSFAPFSLVISTCFLIGEFQWVVADIPDIYERNNSRLNLSSLIKWFSQSYVYQSVRSIKLKHKFL
jgi:hypothetical protein